MGFLFCCLGGKFSVFEISRLLPKVAHQFYGRVKSGTSSAWKGRVFLARLPRGLI